ncbi:MAG: ABC transporter substrate-binding protein [Clostridiaceae bacterium]|nr:ABC transporter substrate-binding protein [Clostridiaceae bacterium]
MKRIFRKVLVFVTVIVYSCSMTSCQEVNTFSNTGGISWQADNSIQSDNIIDSGPVKGGTLNLFCTYPDILDPLLTKNPYLQTYFSFVYDSMIKLSKNQSPEGKLCDKWFVSEDGYTWTFHVREGIVWQDGYPFTAEDIEFTIERLLSYKQDTIYAYNIDNISSVTAINRNTVEITLKKPNAFTPELMTFPIVSSRFYSNPENVSGAFKMKFPPGTGAYSLKAYEENSNMLLTASKSWWGRKLDDTKDTIEIPYISDINIKFFKNSREAFGAFQAGSIDVIFADESDIDLYTGKTTVSSKKYINGKWDFISFNLSNTVLSDKTARQFIYSCINKSEIIEDVFQERVIESNIPLIPGTWLHETDEWIEGLSNNKENHESIYTSSKMELLEKGWEEYNGELFRNVYGVLHPVKLEILVNEENADRIKIAEKIAQNLNDKGINVTLNIVSWEQLLNLVKSKKYDMAILGCTIPDYPDLSYIYSTPYLDYLKFSTTPEYPSATNISGFYNEKVQDLIEKIYISRNRNEIKKLFSQLKEIIDDEVPYAGLFFHNNAIIYNNNVRGDIDPYLWDEYNNITKWYLVK